MTNNELTIWWRNVDTPNDNIALFCNGIKASAQSILIKNFFGLATDRSFFVLLLTTVSKQQDEW